MIPAEQAADFTLWRESTVPFFGVVHDPNDDSLRWVDLSEAAVLDVDAQASPVITGPYGRPSVPVPAENRLVVDLPAFLTAADTSWRRRSGSPAAALLAEDAETAEVGIVDPYLAGEDAPQVLEELIESDGRNSDEGTLFSISHSLSEVEQFEHLTQSIADHGGVFIF